MMPISHNVRRSSRAGFTIIEMVVTLFIFTGIMALISQFGWDIAQISLQLQQDLDAQQEVSSALQALSLDLRATAPSASGGYGIESAGTSSLIFYSDADGNGTTDRIRYYIGTSTLNRGLIKASGTPAVYPTSSELVNVVMHNVLTASSSLFSYYDSNYAGSEASMTVPIAIANIRIIRFGITVDKFPGSTPGPLVASMSVALRNYKSN